MTAADAAAVRTAADAQVTLVSGTNIKTVNSTSLLGSGDIVVSASPAGSSGQVQFNSAGSFGGAAAVVYATSGTHIVVTGQVATDVPLCAKGAASHSVNLIEGQTSASAPVFFVRYDGRTVSRNAFAVANSGGTEVGRISIFGVDTYIDCVGSGGTTIFRTNSGNKTPLTLGVDSVTSAIFQHGISVGAGYTASPNNTVNHASIAATGGTTNVSVSIVPKGTGAFCLAVPDGTATGGNARGANSADLQTSRALATQVASGQYSLVGGFSSTSSARCTVALGYECLASGSDSVSLGMRNTASGINSTAIGRNCGAYGEFAVAIGGYNSAGAQNSLATGLYSSAYGWGYQAHAAGKFSVEGDAQRVLYVARIKTTNGTATTLAIDGSGTRPGIPSGKVFSAMCRICGIKSDGSAVANYVRRVVIKNVAGTTSLVGAVETIGTDIEDNASTDVAITADNTNDALQINVTGIAAETWRWVAVVEGLEIAYGT